jgi:hypothetical protein
MSGNNSLPKKSSLRRRTIQRISSAFLALAVLFTPSFASAQCAQNTQSKFQVGEDFIKAVSKYYNIAIGIAIIGAILMIIIGGYLLVVSAGNTQLIDRGKKTIFNAIFGLILALLSAAILNFLNPRILCSQGTPTTMFVIEQHDAS